MRRTASLRRLVGPVLALGAALSLQGCVAAVFPLAAGGLLGDRVLSDRGEDESRTTEVASRATIEDRAAVRRPADPINADLVPIDPNPTGIANTAPGSPTPASPAPTSSAPTQSPEYAPGSGFAINQLLSYANQRQIASDEVPESVMLSDRVKLKPELEQCNAITPTILIDLDPEGGVFDPSLATRPPSGLAVGLARLRLGGVAIAWISANPDGRVNEVRNALARSGLDPHEEDRLLLLRNSNDRKQKLREELAGVTCLIAIAGDTRSDFDELYDYLRNPADAQSLEPLIGDGWFLIPQPLLPERPNS